MVMSFGGIGMGGMSNFGNGNVYQNIKAKYGCGHADFGERPKIAPYPMEIIPKAPTPNVQKSSFGRLLNKLYG